MMPSEKSAGTGGGSVLVRQDSPGGSLSSGGGALVVPSTSQGGEKAGRRKFSLRVNLGSTGALVDSMRVGEGGGGVGTGTTVVRDPQTFRSGPLPPSAKLRVRGAAGVPSGVLDSTQWERLPVVVRQIAFNVAGRGGQQMAVDAGASMLGAAKQSMA